MNAWISGGPGPLIYLDFRLFFIIIFNDIAPMCIIKKDYEALAKETENSGKSTKIVLTIKIPYR